MITWFHACVISLCHMELFHAMVRIDGINNQSMLNC